MGDSDIVQLEEKIGYFFSDKSLIRDALQHSSFVNEQRDSSLNSNERLEFLGDAVLGLIVSEMLMSRFPGADEGDLSQMRAAIVNESQLAEIAQKMLLGQYMSFGRGETLAGGDEKKSILAGCFEAVVAAIYLDGGIEPASTLIASIFSEIIEFISIPQKQVDYKTRLQEYAQLHYKTIPRYEVTGENGPAHDKSFTVAMTLKPGITSEGHGKSKKKAEQDAAEKCLRLLNELPASS